MTVFVVMGERRQRRVFGMGERGQKWAFVGGKVGYWAD